jgi:hypothetical protein
VYQLYETTLVNSDRASAGNVGPPRTVGINVLTSPPRVDDHWIPYEELLDEVDLRFWVPSSEAFPNAVTFVPQAVAFVSDPRNALVDDPALLTPEFISERSPSGPFFQRLATEPLIPSEASPFTKRSIVDLATLAGSGGLAVFGGAPAILLVGGKLGLAVIRGVGGASGGGVPPELAEFSGDTATEVMDFLTRKLGIPPRRR